VTHPAQLAHRTEIPIRWGDLDAYGHVNNTVFFRFMEQARVEWLETLSHSLRPEGEGPVIVNACCTFLVQVNYPGVVTVDLLVGPPGRSSIPTRYELRCGDTVVAQGESKVVWIDFSTGKSVPLPEAIRARLPGGGV
jgi:acyl-CoA thioester hydrolase